jgi:ATP-dependent Clp protease ATP-binding subunit ClpA
MFERFLPSARAVVEKSQAEAVRLNQAQVRPDHFLLALTALDTGIASHILRSNGLTVDRVESAITTTVLLEVDGNPLTRADADALLSFGVDLQAIIHRIESLGPAALSPIAARRRTTPGRHVPLSSAAKAALVAALAAARELDHHYIGSEHLLLGVLSHKRSVAIDVLELFDTTADTLRAQILSELKQAS